MKILFITKLLPYPPDAGGKLKTYKILQLLAQKHEIHFVSFIDTDSSLQSHSEIQKICSSVKTFSSSIINQKHKIYLAFKFLSSLFLDKPFTVYKYYSPDFAKYIQEVLKRKKIDLLYVDHIAMAQYVPDDFDGKLICDEHNISYLAFQSYAKIEKNPLLKLIYLLESKKLHAYEKNWFPKFDHIFTISELDKARLQFLGISRSKISFLPIPFQPQNCFCSTINPPTILFVGLLSWLPNKKGIIWFIEEIFPLIRANIPKAKLLIVGNDGGGLKQYISRRNISNIIYKGYISDLKTIYRHASVFIAPIQMGGGVRIKILDALSHGIPVVSTSLGSEGISSNDGETLFIANTPELFAEKIRNLLNNLQFASTLSTKGLRMIQKEYSSKKSLQVLNKVIDGL